MIINFVSFERCLIVGTIFFNEEYLKGELIFKLLHQVSKKLKV